MSFATPYADSVAPSVEETERSYFAPVEINDILGARTNISFSSPEASFTAPLPHEIAHADEVAEEFQRASLVNKYVSYASAESDFCAEQVLLSSTMGIPSLYTSMMDAKVPYSFASPETDFSNAPIPDGLMMSAADVLTSPDVSHLSFASAESDFTSADVTYSSTLKKKDVELPRTLKAALQPSKQARVITEARYPFRITHVNDAWEG